MSNTVRYCVVCYDPIKIYAVGECDHRDTCYKCILRRRYFYNDNECPVCKIKTDAIIMTKNPNDTYDNMLKSSHLLYNHKYDIYFDNKQLEEEVLSLLAFRCPKCVDEYSKQNKPAPTFPSAKLLLIHVTSQHNLEMCEYCLRGNKLFPYEQQLYTESEFRHHLNYGQKGSNTQVPIEPHPKCKFCHKRFFDKTTLYEHMEQRYPFCIFCPKDESIFFRTKEELWDHYRKKHFVCDNPQCEDYAIFPSYLELLSHKQSFHGEKKLVVDLNFINKKSDEDRNKENALKRDRQLREEKSNLYIVPDLSGYSNEELEKLNKKLYEDIYVFFHKDQGKMNRFIKLSRNYLDGTITAVMIHDLYLQLFGVDHVELISRIISLVPDPVKKHILETIFRQAKGHPASTLDKEFINSVGGNTITAKVNTDLLVSPDSNVRKSQSFNNISKIFQSSDPVDSSIDKEESPQYSLSSSPVDRTSSSKNKENIKEKEKEEKEEDLLPKKVISEIPPIPKGISIPFQVWSSWHIMQSTLDYLIDIKKKLVLKNDINLCATHYSLCQVCYTIIKSLDEILYQKARSKEQWPGIPVDSVHKIKNFIQSQSDKSIGNISFVRSFGINGNDYKTFDDYYNLFKLSKEPYYRLPVIDNNYDWILSSIRDIPPYSLSVIKETFSVLFTVLEERITNRVRNAVTQTKNSKQVRSNLELLPPGYAFRHNKNQQKSHSLSPLPPTYLEVVKPSNPYTPSLVSSQPINTNTKNNNKQRKEKSLSINSNSSKVTEPTIKEEFPSLTSVYKNEPSVVVDSSLQQMRNNTKKYKTSKLAFTQRTSPKPPITTTNKPKEKVPEIKSNTKLIDNKSNRINQSSYPSSKPVSISSKEEFPSLVPDSFKPSKKQMQVKSKKEITESQGLSFMGIQITDKLSKKDIQKIEKKFRNMDH